MSPRGVATPNVRELLFTAAERVVRRDGPGALTSRAVTTEAGCAKGLLHAHFDGGIDEFVAELVLDRLSRAARIAEALPERAGRGTVAGNLGEVVDALLDSTGPAVAGLAVTRAGAAERVRAGLESGGRGFAAIQSALTRYLDEERDRGRVAAALDTEAAALALVGTSHHLLMTTRPDSPAPHPQAQAVIALLTRPPT
ncbi:TetR family transcriptional regulator [Mangrovactinospora gilvigrisea]|uniref:TetR family transcriptional regulator n=1 Tax=Mangrovactinospora gilvigrisea TaxID=1428644 RepID=A0A1J7BA85_9ACTN|nr:TetR/AcrR family transcriptional regulator [Mangrovactinospora gilvigrisea]OIV35509.1 TetR family transcriptional regulator [Mangrovactinospora gilvigrisea]